jgi:hypothetical protein
MSIFGKLDAATIPTNPFFIEKGEYAAEVTDAKYNTNRDDVRQLVIKFVITDDNSQYCDVPVTKYFNLVDSEMTQESFELLPADEKKKIRLSMSNLKKFLCGNDGNSNHRGLGVDPDVLNDDNWDPSSMTGTKVIVGITNYGPTNEGVNLQWVNLA